MIAPVPAHERGFSEESRRHMKLASWCVFCVLIVYWIVLFTSTHMSVPKGLIPKGTDKPLHFGAYGVLGVLLLGVRAVGGPCETGVAFRRWLFLLAYGAFDELTQLLVGRHAEVADWLADAAGSGCGIFAVAVASRWFWTRKG